MRPFIICSSCKKHEDSTHFYIHIHRFNSIIYKSISFHEFPRDHSIPFQFPPYIPTPFHSILQEKRKDSKIRFLFLLLDFFTTARKKNTLYFIRRKTPLVIKKKEIEMILASEKTRSKAWHFVVERQTK